MTVQNQNVKNVYRGNGSTTVFPFTFAINESHPEYIHVYITNDGGKAAETTDFTCDMETRTITYPKVSSSAPKLSATQRLTIYRLLPYEQNLNLVNQGPFFSEDVETQLDDLEMQIQQLSENLVRCFQIGIEAQDFDMTMELEPGKVICVNSEGNGFEAREALMEVDGHWDGEGRQIHSVADPTADQDAVTKKYADNRMDNNFMKLQPDGTAWEGRNLPISNVAGPNLVKDAANKDYVDRILAGYAGQGERFVFFDNVAQMKAADLVPSQMAVTLGYHDVNDGGAGVYTIRDIGADTPDEGSIIEITGTSYVAALITDSAVNVKQFGAYGDGIHDDTDAIQNAINTRKTVVIPQGEFLVSKTLNLEYTGGHIKGTTSSTSDIETVPNASRIRPAVSFTGDYVLRVWADYAVTRSLILENFAIIDYRSNVNGIQIGSAYDNVMITNVSVQGVAYDKKAWDFAEKDGHAHQTVVINNIMGTKRAGNSTVPVFYAKHFQECTLINCKMFGAFGGNVADTTYPCYEFEECRTTYVLNCSAALTSGVGFKVRNCAGLRFEHPLFEEVQTPIATDATDWRLLGSISSIPNVGDTVKQGTSTGTVWFATNAGVYITSDDVFTSGTLYKNDGVTVVGTINNAYLMGNDRVNAIDCRCMGTNFSSSMSFTFKALNNSVIDIPPLNDNTIIEVPMPYTILLDTYSVGNKINLASALTGSNTLTDNGQRNEIKVLSYNFVKRIKNGDAIKTYLPSAFIGSKITICKDDDVLYIEVCSKAYSSDTIDGVLLNGTAYSGHSVARLYGNGAKITLECFKTGEWTITKFKGAYYFNVDTDFINCQYSDIKLLYKTSIYQVGYGDSGSILTASSSAGTINLPQCPSGFELTVVNGRSAGTVTVDPQGFNTIIGHESNTKFDIAVGDSCKIIANDYKKIIVMPNGTLTFS